MKSPPTGRHVYAALRRWAARRSESKQVLFDDATRAKIYEQGVQISQERTTADNAFEARVEEVIFKGASDRVTVVTAGGTRLHAVVVNTGASRAEIQIADRILCSIDPGEIGVAR